MKNHSFVILIILTLATNPSLLFPQTYAPLYESGTVIKVTDLTIEGSADDGDYLFAGPSAIAVDSKGNIFVLDSQESHIRKFGPDGAYIKTFSGPGQGPGEILRCYKMTMLADDRLVTFDYGNMRFSLFTPDGTFQKSVPLTDILSFRAFPFGMDADDAGNLYIETHTILRDSKEGDLYKVWQVSDDFSEAHIVDSCYVKDNEWIQTGNRFGNRIIPFAPRFHWATAPGGRLVTGRAASYEIRLFAPDRGLLQTVTHEANRRRITGADKETFFNGLTYSQSGSNEVRHGASEETRKNTKFPSHMPFFGQIQTDEDGNILCMTSENEAGRLLYDIFSPDGTYIRRIPLPPLASTAVFRDGFIYAIEETDDGEPIVVKFHWE